MVTYSLLLEVQSHYEKYVEVLQKARKKNTM